VHQPAPPAHGGLYAWEFEQDGRELKARVEGQLILNGVFQIRNAALAGFGLAYMPADLAQPYIEVGRLVRVLADWCPPWSGYHLYYPSRRGRSPRRPAFASGRYLLTG
jgi:DNA-binding transcriptional LysR family regulator